MSETENGISTLASVLGVDNLEELHENEAERKLTSNFQAICEKWM